ncbi:MAG: TIGR02147 family protein [Pseudobdellovibrionaceae bacterium]
MKTAPVLKTIFEYDDFRAYLRDYYAYSKSQNKNFSYRFFARLGDFKSGNILKIVIDGKINIVPETATKFCKALKFNKEESTFFKNLVLFNQATTSEEKQKYSKELLRSATFKTFYPLSEFQYHYFDLWYFPVVRGLVALPEFQEDPVWIAERIKPRITPAEARKALEELKALGLVCRDKTGKLIQANPTVVTSNSITSAALAKYHREMMKKAGESIDRFPRESRDLSAMTLGVSAESVKIIKEMMEKFRRDIIEVASKDQGIDSVYQLNVYLFPVTEVEKKERGQ